jgi:hypothetical protein
MLLLQCTGCKTIAFTENHSDPDPDLECDCCPEDHHHGQAGNAGKPCRPMTITVMPGSGPEMHHVPTGG